MPTGASYRFATYPVWCGVFVKGRIVHSGQICTFRCNRKFRLCGVSADVRHVPPHYASVEHRPYMIVRFVAECFQV